MSILIVKILLSEQGFLVLSQQQAASEGRIISAIRDRLILGPGVSLPDPVSAEVRGDRDFETVLEVARELHRRGLAMPALERLEGISPRLMDTAVTPDQRMTFFAVKAGALLSLNKVEESAAAFTEAYRASPDNPCARWPRGYAAYLRGKDEAALEFFDEALAKDPALEFAQAIRAHTLLRLGRGAELEPLWAMDHTGKDALIKSLGGLQIPERLCID